MVTPALVTAGWLLAMLTLATWLCRDGKGGGGAPSA